MVWTMPARDEIIFEITENCVIITQKLLADDDAIIYIAKPDFDYFLTMIETVRTHLWEIEKR